MDTNIRAKTTAELARETFPAGDWINEKPVDTRTEAIKAMAKALEDMGYTRETDARYIPGPDVWHAITAMRSCLRRHGDEGFLMEFWSEPGGFMAMDEALDQDDALDFMHKARQRIRWYGESFLQEALDMLPSASEIARDRQIDQDIDERKLA